MSKSEVEWSKISLKKRIAKNLVNLNILFALAGTATFLVSMIEEFKGLVIDLPGLVFSLVLYGLLTMFFQGILIWEQDMVDAAIRDVYK